MLKCKKGNVKVKKNAAKKKEDVRDKRSHASRMAMFRGASQMLSAYADGDITHGHLPGAPDLASALLARLLACYPGRPG